MPDPCVQDRTDENDKQTSDFPVLDGVSLHAEAELVLHFLKVLFLNITCGVEVHHAQCLSINLPVIFRQTVLQFFED